MLDEVVEQRDRKLTHAERMEKRYRGTFRCDNCNRTTPVPASKWNKIAKDDSGNSLAPAKVWERRKQVVFNCKRRQCRRGMK